MYSGMRSTSALYQSYPCHQNQSSGMMNNEKPGFGEQHYEEFYGQLHSAVNPSYSTFESYPMHQTQNRGFGGVQQSSMTDNGPFYHRGFTYHPLQQQALTYPVSQPVAQAQAQQAEVKRNAEEDVLVVKLEPPIFPKSKPRLRWTPELHARFIRAAVNLGGLFRAKPKAILEKMNVRGITVNQLKSHLQKVRYKNPNGISIEEIVGHGIQDNANSHAPQFSKGKVSSSSRPAFGSGIGEYGRLLRSVETPNYHQNLRIAPGEDHAFGSGIGEYGRLLRSVETPNYHQNLRIAPGEDHANYFNFEEFDLKQIVP